MRLQRRLLTLSLIITVLFASSVATTRAQTISVPSSQPSATPVSDEAFRRAVAEALEELRAARKLIDAQKAEIKTKDELIDLERKVSEGLKDLRSLDAAQRAELEAAIKDKDRVIANLEAEVAVLKKNSWTFGKAVKYIAFGVAGGIIVTTVLRK